MATPRAIAEPRSTWLGADLAGKDTVCFDLQARHLAALEAEVASIRGRSLATESLTRADFPLAAIADELAGLAEELTHGRGLLVLRGFPVSRWSPEDLATAYFGLGTHFGVAVSQSVIGDRLGRVEDLTASDPHARGYRNNRELTLHTDFADIVSFLCVRQAKAGGESWFASALAVHDLIAAERPDLLAVLERGFHWHRYGEQGEDAAPVTPWRVPVFPERDGRLSCRYIRNYIIEGAAHESLAPLSPIANLRLWMHKRMCEACALFAEQSKTIDGLMDKRGTQGPLPDTTQLEEQIIRSVAPDDAQ